MTANRRISAASIIGNTVVREKWLSIGIILTVTGAVVISLLPPLVLGKIIDRIAGGNFPGFSMAAEYFLLIFLSGALESLRESFLTVFGQKMTHAFRSELSKKLVRLSADTLNKEEPGAVVISMSADACRVISIFAVIWFQNRGLALLLVVLIPVIFAFTRIVQKQMLTAQLENRAAMSRVTNHVPETIRCIRTIHTLGKETYMEKRYDDYIGESYSAVEKTNFYDAVYSPLILFLNAVAVASCCLRHPETRRSWHCSACPWENLSQSSTIFPRYSRRSRTSAWRSRRSSRRLRVFTGSTSFWRSRRGRW